MSAAHTASHWIYWEPQDRLNCAVHSCNSVLQTALFTQHNFECIARTLDDREKAAGVADGGAGGGSHNFTAADGMFSIQVVIAALEQVGLSVQFMRSKAHAIGLLQPASRSPESEIEQAPCSSLSQCHAIICNRKDHWIPLRRIHGQWYNLNSLSKQGPKKMSATRVLDSVEKVFSDAFTVCFVVGSVECFPKLVLEQSAFAQVPHQGLWLDSARIKETLPSAKQSAALQKALVAGSNPREKALALVKLAIALDTDVTQKLKSQNPPSRSLVVQALRKAAHLYDTGAIFFEQSLDRATNNVKGTNTSESVTAARICGYRARAAALRTLFADDSKSQSSGCQAESGKR